jgi:hypothetical protein
LASPRIRSRRPATAMVSPGGYERRPGHDERGDRCEVDIEQWIRTDHGSLTPASSTLRSGRLFQSSQCCRLSCGSISGVGLLQPTLRALHVTRADDPHLLDIGHLGSPWSPSVTVPWAGRGIVTSDRTCSGNRTGLLLACRVGGPTLSRTPGGGPSPTAMAPDAGPTGRRGHDADRDRGGT